MHADYLERVVAVESRTLELDHPVHASQELLVRYRDGRLIATWRTSGPEFAAGRMIQHCRTWGM